MRTFVSPDISRTGDTFLSPAYVFVRTGVRIIVVILNILTGDVRARGAVWERQRAVLGKRTPRGGSASVRGRRRIRTLFGRGGRDEAGGHESCDRE